MTQQPLVRRKRLEWKFNALSRMWRMWRTRARAGDGWYWIAGSDEQGYVAKLEYEDYCTWTWSSSDDKSLLAAQAACQSHADAEWIAMTEVVPLVFVDDKVTGGKCAVSPVGSYWAGLNGEGERFCDEHHRRIVLGD